MPSALECRNIAKSFLLNDTVTAWRILFNRVRGKRFHALRNVTIDVPKGQFVGILGRNGAGKSTLLRTIGGVYAPDSGVTVVNGDMSTIYELGLTGNEHLTGRSFSRRWFEVFSAPGQKRKVLIEDVLDFSELGEAFDRPIRSYSAGMKARLFFALATARESDIYVIDEVLAVGDEYFQNKCWRRLRQRLNNGAAGIIATHDWSAILRLCPTSYIIDDGRTIARGPSPSVVRQYLGLTNALFEPGATFEPEPPKELTGKSREDFTAEIEIKVTGDIPVSFGAAVEVFQPGTGWEHILHTDPQPIGVGPGTFRVEISVPALPLKGGEYSLAIGLSRPDPSGGQATLDVRSWTYGEGLVLRVDGEDSNGAVRWPLTIREQAGKAAAA